MTLVDSQRKGNVFAGANPAVVGSRHDQQPNFLGVLRLIVVHIRPHRPHALFPSKSGREEWGEKERDGRAATTRTRRTTTTTARESSIPHTITSRLERHSPLTCLLYTSDKIDVPFFVH
jgi:hypothetical protein